MSELRPTAIERAYEIARLGKAQTVEDIISQLDKEGYTNARGQLSGPSLRKTLRALCATARDSRAGESGQV